MILRKLLILSILILFSFIDLYAVDFRNGNIRLNINRRNGNFSLFYFLGFDVIQEASLYEPLFNSREPSASHLSVNIDGNIYRLDRSRAFRTSFENRDGNPAIIYRSSFLTVSKVFTPVRTGGSLYTNGVMLTITMQNTADRPVNAGLRFLLDTHLGEGRGNEHFSTGSRSISREAVVTSESGEMFWISRGRNVSLMGSIVNPLDNNSRTPDLVHFANWRRLNSSSWHLRPSEGRSFSYFPYFTRDSAVCYFFEPSLLDSGDSFTYTIFLTTEDADIFTGGASISILNWEEVFLVEAAVDIIDIDITNDEDANLILMLRLQETLRQFLDREIHLDEHDIREIESSIDGLRALIN